MIGNLEVAKLLLANGADIEQADEVYATPLYIAARHGHLEIVDLLLSNGAQVVFALFTITRWMEKQYAINRPAHNMGNTCLTNL